MSLSTSTRYVKGPTIPKYWLKALYGDQIHIVDIPPPNSQYFGRADFEVYSRMLTFDASNLPAQTADAETLTGQFLIGGNDMLEPFATNGATTALRPDIFLKPGVKDGTNPILIAQFFALWQNYEVLGSTITLECWNDSSHDIVIGLAPSTVSSVDGSNYSANITAAITYRQAMHVENFWKNKLGAGRFQSTITADGASRATTDAGTSRSNYHKMIKTAWTRDIFANTDIEDAFELQGLFNSPPTSPAKDWFWNIFVVSDTTAELGDEVPSNTTIRFRFKMVFHTILMGNEAIDLTEAEIAE